jgi:hypothetical protein
VGEHAARPARRTLPAGLDVHTERLTHPSEEADHLQSGKPTSSSHMRVGSVSTGALQSVGVEHRQTGRAPPTSRGPLQAHPVQIRSPRFLLFPKRPKAIPTRRYRTSSARTSRSSTTTDSFPSFTATTGARGPRHPARTGPPTPSASTSAPSRMAPWWPTAGVAGISRRKIMSASRRAATVLRPLHSSGQA